MQNGRSDAAAENDSGEHSIVDSRHFALIFHRVTRGNVSDFVRHHAREFGFVVGGENQTFINVEKSAGQGEGIHFVAVNNFNSEGNFRVRVQHDVLTYAVDVFGD